MVSRATTTLLALGMLTCPVLAGAQARFSTRTLGVRVDVLVTDGRTPVAGLSAADFGLPGTFQRILSEFRSRYVLAYTPDGVTPGGFHKIEVTVPHRRVTVKARPGYAGAGGASGS